MYLKELQELGLTKNEASVYDVLLQRKSATAGQIIKETRLHRNIVYENLDKLIEKGIVSFIHEGKRRVYQAEPLHVLVELFKKQEQEVKQKQEIAEKLKKLVEKTKAYPSVQEASIFRGVKGIMEVMHITLEQNANYVVLGAPQQSVELMPPAFWENFNKKLQEKKTKVRLLFNESLREWSKKIKHPTNEIRFLPQQFDSLTETNICKDYVFIFTWSSTPLVISIRDKHLAEGYKKYFEYLWKVAKP